MALHLKPPIIYLITSGTMTPDSNRGSEDFQNTLALVSASVKARVSLIQLREKNLAPKMLYELTARSAAITQNTGTRLLVNDRADIARAARADGVHLTTQSIEASVIRRSFGPDFLIGVSTHTLSEARAARDDGADFAVFGPIFDTPSKRAFGPPLGLEKLREAAQILSPFPLIALGGITRENATETFSAGASGVAAIRLFDDPQNLNVIVESLVSGRIGEG